MSEVRKTKSARERPQLGFTYSGGPVESVTIDQAASAMLSETAMGPEPSSQPAAACSTNGKYGSAIVMERIVILS